jgi:hypothetical protein
VRRLVLASLAALLLTLPTAAEAAHPTCFELRTQSYAMFSRAGNRAVGRVVARVAPVCHDGHRLPKRRALEIVRLGLNAIRPRYGEVWDTAVLEEVADALQRAGVANIDALDRIS